MMLRPHNTREWPTDQGCIQFHSTFEGGKIDLGFKSTESTPSAITCSMWLINLTFQSNQKLHTNISNFPYIKSDQTILNIVSQPRIRMKKQSWFQVTPHVWKNRIEHHKTHESQIIDSCHWGNHLASVREICKNHHGDKFTHFSHSRRMIA